MEVSVIIPTYNRVSLTLRAIRSVLDQTLAPGELIVVDDGSDDGTASRIAVEFPSVRVLVQAHAGVSTARNLGILAAGCEWVAFLDSDDVWLPHKLQCQADLLADNPQLMVCHTDEIWIKDGRRINPGRRHAKPEGRIFRQCVPRCCVSPSSILMHKEVLAVTGCFDPHLPVCEDYDLWLRIFSRYPAGLVKNHCLIKAGGHADQLSRRYWGMDRFRVQSLEKILTQQALDAGDRQICVDTLQHKCAILVQGMERRGNYEEAEYYRQLSGRWDLGSP